MSRDASSVHNASRSAQIGSKKKHAQHDGFGVNVEGRAQQQINSEIGNTAFGKSHLDGVFNRGWVLYQFHDCVKDQKKTQQSFDDRACPPDGF